MGTIQNVRTFSVRIILLPKHPNVRIAPNIPGVQCWLLSIVEQLGALCNVSGPHHNNWWNFPTEMAPGAAAASSSVYLHLVISTAAGCSAAGHWSQLVHTSHFSLELQTKVHAKVRNHPTRAFSWLKAPKTLFKTLWRHYAKQTLTPRPHSKYIWHQKELDSRFCQFLSPGCINLKNLCAHHKEEVLRIPKHP